LWTWRRGTSAAVAEGRADRFAKRLGAVEDHEEAPIGAKPAILEIRHLLFNHRRNPSFDFT